jgi:lactoylglutathione lyase
MRIAHIAIWVKDLEVMRSFYMHYFGARSNELYHNQQKQFRSYFLSFDDGCSLEIMHRSDILEAEKDYNKQQTGLVHFAISVGSKSRVDEMAETFMADGFQVVGQPRLTGDGYYEAVVLDPEGNIVEVTI